MDEFLKHQDPGSFLKPFIVANIALTASLLELHWAIITFAAIVLLEAFILNVFLRKPVVSLRIALVSNIITSLITVPLMFIPELSITEYFPMGVDTWSLHGPDVHSIWLIPIVFVYSFFQSLPTEPPLSYSFNTGDLIMFSIYFILAFVGSVIVESYYAKIDLKKIEKTDQEYKRTTLWILLSNVASYFLILASLIILGILTGLNPAAGDPVTNLESWLFTTIDSSLVDLLIALSWISIIVIIAVIIIYAVKLVSPQVSQYSSVDRQSEEKPSMIVSESD